MLSRSVYQEHALINCRSRLNYLRPGSIAIIAIKGRTIEAAASRGRTMGKGILLWLIGIPIPVILVLFLIFHH